MRAHDVRRRVIGMMLALGTATVLAGCNLIGPGCNNESGVVANVSGDVGPGETRTYSVASPKNSNLVMRLTWTNPQATVQLRATITDCGGHTGCQMITSMPTFGPGGTSPVPQPWPAGYREMLVDGWKGKTYRIEVVGDEAVATPFILDTSYKITCER